MIAFTDVHYEIDHAHAACVLVERWDADVPARTFTAVVSPIAEYEPGAFYKRELPCLLEVLSKVGPVEVVVIDGYVWLDREGTPGLGARLFDALKIPVIGIAKTAFKGSEMALPLERPGTEKPLFVTAAGMSADDALAFAKQLHGPYRIPTLLKKVDDLARRK